MSATSSTVDLGIPDISAATPVGRGGFGIVYRARQEKIGRTVAVKVLSVSVLGEDERHRIERECQTLGSVSGHPNIVAIFDSGASGEQRPYLVMDYLPGGTLAEGPIVGAALLGGAVLPPGRGFVEGSREIQTPLVGDDPSGNRSASAIASEAARLVARHPGLRAPQLQRMPAHHPRASLPAPADAAQPYIGVDEIDVAPVRVDLRESHFFIAGPYRSGRTSALTTLVRSIELAPGPRELHLLAPRRTALLDLDGWTTSARGSDA